MTAPLSRIEQALAQLGNEHQPPEGWEVKVLEATSRPRRRRWWLGAMPILALALVLLWIGFVGGDGVPSSELKVALSYDKPGTVVRSVATPHAGDILHAKATGGAGYRAIWIYRNELLVASCPGSTAWCRAERDATITDLALRPGEYRIVSLSSNAPLPLPSGTYGHDFAVANDVGRSAGKAPVDQKLTVVP